MDPIYLDLFPVAVSIRPGAQARVVLTTTSAHLWYEGPGDQTEVYPFDPDSLPPEYPRTSFTVTLTPPSAPPIAMTISPQGGCGCGSRIKTIKMPQQVHLPYPTRNPTPAPTP